MPTVRKFVVATAFLPTIKLLPGSFFLGETAIRRVAGRAGSVAE